MAHDVTRLGTDGTADTDFGGSFLDGNHHDVAHPNGSGQQSAQSYHPTEDVDTFEQVVYHAEKGFGINAYHGLLVVGVYQVGFLEHWLDACLDILDGVSRSGRVA